MYFRIFGLVIAGFMISGCSKPEKPAEVAIAAEDAPAPVAYYEYLWCQRGENWSMDAAQSYVDDWNAELDAMDDTLEGAFVYVPRGWEDERFDTYWALRFSDKASSEQGWVTWLESGANDRLQENHPGVLEYGDEIGVNRFGWDLYSLMEIPSGFGDNEPYFVQSRFCTFNEGKNRKDLREVVRGQFLPEIQAGKQAGTYPSYWFMVGVPDFESTQPIDFVWIDYFDGAEAAETESGIYESSEEGQAIQSAFDAVTTCSEALPYDAYALRRPADS
ncbi:MAG: hypothetical protein CMQ40_07920 [Gammaproteobacteria bacterium]|nr:hypothetical protein [Gammaproteobacteria bacterium]